MTSQLSSADLLHFVASRIEVGILAVDLEMRVVVWNRFLEAHSGKSASEIVGRSLFDVFPELPRAWLERKIKSVVVLKNFSFTSWRQRPYLFRFRHHRPITGGIDVMRQDCTFLPVVAESGEVAAVCITVVDATETCLYQTKLDEALAIIAEQSVRDALTGVYNRRRLEEKLTAELGRAVRYKRPLSLLIFDIDHFKRVNDERGHLAGDEVIRHVAKVASACLRDSDLVGRYGGEEFVVLLPEIPSAGAVIVGERIRESVAAAPAKFEGKEIAVTVSVGVAEAGSGPRTPESLLGEADEALYLSKKNGRNRVSLRQPPRTASGMRRGPDCSS
jgi:diguanylate cyclase (GGDEF)-like protein